MLGHFVCKGLCQIRQHFQVGNEQAAFKTQGQNVSKQTVITAGSRPSR